MRLETNTDEDIKRPRVLLSQFEAALSELNKKLTCRWQTARRLFADAIWHGSPNRNTPLPMWVTKPNLVVLC